MGVIYLVRHAQASFGTDDYDPLTPIGFTQARLLGEYFARRKIRFDAVYAGTLRRHAETAQAIAAGEPDRSAPPAQCLPGLNEYKPEALLVAFTGVLPEPAVVREHFRLLRDALLAWALDRIQPDGMPSWQAFQDGAVAALTEARGQFADGNVLVVSSGGPIAAIVAAVLRAPPESAVELNLRIRNSSVTEFAMSARSHQLVSFNALPHLEAQSDPDLTTYASDMTKL